MTKIETENAPKAIGPYSQAMISGNLVYTSGQIALNPLTGSIEGNDIKTQTEQALKNLSEVLKAAGSDCSKVIKTTCFLANIDDFAAFNEVYEKFFTNKPARSCFSVKALPKMSLVEVEAIAEL